MKELVDYCYLCQKPLYCLDGFFNGVQIEGGKSICFDCEERSQKEEIINES
jgi:hypothetical protein